MRRKKHKCTNCRKVFFEASDNNRCFDCRKRERYAPATHVIHGFGY